MFLDLVSRARSCREFAAERPLPPGALEWLVECARRAPSARNAQDLRFILVGTPGLCTALSQAAGWAKRGGKAWRPAPERLATGFIVVLEPEKDSELHHIDVGIACQTIQLAAAERGLGCCILWAFDRKAVRALLPPPALLKPAILLAVGHAAQERKLVLPPSTGSTETFDEGGVHYVPKRPVEELIVGRF